MISQPLRGTLSGIAPDLSYKPDENYHGDDSFSFGINDGNATGNSAAVSLRIVSVNDPPVANAGSDRSAWAGDVVSIDGSGSYDVDGDSLRYNWSFLSVPMGSTAAILDPSAVDAEFEPDIAGSYEFQLIVNDGTINSTPDTVVVKAETRTVTVPDVVGRTQVDAKAALIGAKLAMGTISTSYSETVQADHIISQSQAAGASVVEGSALDLVVSLGQRPPAPAVYISTLPAEIHPGESSILEWQTSDAISCFIEPDIGPVSVNGNIVIWGRATPND